MALYTLRVQKPNSTKPEDVLNMYFEDVMLRDQASREAYDLGYEILSHGGDYVIHQDMTDARNTLEAWMDMKS